MLVSFAGDVELAARAYRFLTSALSDTGLKLEEDEIIFTADSIDRSRVHRLLESFLSLNKDLPDYAITSFENVFTVGILKNLDELVIRCEMCGRIFGHHDELILHRRLHGLVYGLG